MLALLHEGMCLPCVTCEGVAVPICGLLCCPHRSTWLLLPISSVCVSIMHMAVSGSVPLLVTVSSYFSNSNILTGFQQIFPKATVLGVLSDTCPPISHLQEKAIMWDTFYKRGC